MDRRITEGLIDGSVDGMAWMNVRTDCWKGD